MNEHSVNLTTISNFNTICRVCLNENENLQFIWEVYVQNEQEQQKEQLNLSKLFKKYCNIEIKSTDEKPEKICSACASQFIQCHCFFEKVYWSNSLLNNIVQGNVLKESQLDVKFDDNDLKKNLRRKSNSNATSDNYLDISEDDAIQNDNENDDSDWEPSKIEDKNESAVKLECSPDYNYVKDNDIKTEKEATSSEEEFEYKRISRKRKCQITRTLPRKKGRGRHQAKMSSRKMYNQSINETSQGIFECRFCKKYLNEINNAVDHYDECHAPELEQDQCILCDKTKIYKQRDNLLYHMALHWKNSIKCIPCRKYFRNHDMLLEHKKECFKCPEIKTENYIDKADISQNKKNIEMSSHNQIIALTMKQIDGAFKCQLCSKKLGEFNSVLDHYDSDHTNELQCILCLRAFTKYVPLFHLGLHSKKSHLCRPCKKIFRTQEKLDEHNSKYDHDRSRACKICGKTFSGNYKKNKHMLSHFQEKNYSCSKCGKTFTYKTSLSRHFKIHFGKRFLCSSCGNSYTTKFMLQRHFTIMHTNVDDNGKPLPKPPPVPVNLQCEFCGEIFTSKTGYGRHIRRHPQFNQYNCKICSFICDNKEQLDDHMEQKHNKYTCEECGKRFPFESQLKSHFRKHEDMTISKFRCDVCGKTARTRQQLEIHYRIHTGERPFPCDICGKSFKQAAHLKVHMYQHTGKMPFKCKMCDKAFPFQTIMEIHMRTHTGEKPFQCRYCGNAYHDRTTMKKHQKKKHPEMPVEKVIRGEYRRTQIM